MNLKVKHRSVCKVIVNLVVLFQISLCSAQLSHPDSDPDSLLLIKANQFFQTSHFDSAIYYYRKFLYASDSCKALRGDKFLFLNPGLDPVKSLQPVFLLGTNYCLVSNPLDAISVLKTGLMIIDSLSGGIHYLKPWFLYQVANAYLIENEYPLALDYFHQALRNIKKDDPLNQQINQNLGGVYFFMEDYDKAVECFQKAWVMKTSDGEKDYLKNTELLINLGSSYAQLKDYKKALKYFSKSKETHDKFFGKDSLFDARNHLNVGIVFSKMPDFENAYFQFQKSLEIYSKFGQSINDELIVLYASIARLFRQQMVLDSATLYLDLAINTIKQRHYIDSLVISNLYREFGETFELQGRWQEALDYYERSLKYMIFGDEDSIPLWINKFPNLAKIIEIYRIKQCRARLYHRVGAGSGSIYYFRKSFDEYLAAIRFIDQVNQELGRDGSKLLFNESAKDLYYGALETGYFLLSAEKDHRFESLYKIAEESKVRILLNGFMNKIAKKISGIPDSLLQREDLLMNEISGCIANLFINTYNADLINKDRYLLYLNKLLDRYEEIDSLNSIFKRSSLVYQSLTKQSQNKGYSDIKARLLKDEAVLEYFIGDSALFIFLVRQDSLILIRIPILNDFRTKITVLIKAIKGADIYKFNEVSSELYNILILPVRASLSEIRKLVIIPDESLSVIPFEALISGYPDSGLTTTIKSSQFLINEFEITYHFSASLWLNSLDQVREVSSPVRYIAYAPALPSVAASKNRSVRIKEKNDPVFQVNRGMVFNYLPYTREEVSTVSDLIRKNKGEGKILLADEATKSSFKCLAKNYNVIHIATHSLVDEENPDLSGLIFFPEKNESVEEDGNNGFLMMKEIFNLKLNPDLLVLSACATGSGKITYSEGILALTRGFFFAGASNILYTLSNITDKHTKDFMTAFFKKVISGQSYSSALRNTKLEMINNPVTSLPKIWSEYVLLGR